MDTNGYVFLSYSLVDEAVAQALAAKLVGQDISVWAQTGRDFGPDWRTVIRERVLGASLFVLIASDASRTSIWVARELVWARSHRIPIETLHLLGPAAPGASGSPTSDTDRAPDLDAFIERLRPHFGTVQSASRVCAPPIVHAPLVPHLKERAAGWNHPGGITSLCWLDDGSRLATAGFAGTLRVWRTSGASASDPQVKLHTDWIWRAAASSRGAIATAGHDGVVGLWRPGRRGQYLPVSLVAHRDWIWALAWSPDGSILASGGYDAKIILWDAETGDNVTPVPDDVDWVWSLAWSPDGTTLASAGESRQIRLVDVNTGQQQLFLGHAGGIFSLEWQPAGALIASASGDTTIRLWDSAFGSLRNVFTGHTGWVLDVSWSPDGRYVASVANDRTLRIWSASLVREPLQTTIAVPTCLTSVAWSPDGQRLAAGGHDGRLRIWDVAWHA